MSITPKSEDPTSAAADAPGSAPVAPEEAPGARPVPGSDAASGARPASAPHGRRRWWRAVALVVCAVLVGVPGWWWYDSRLPDAYSVMDLGHPDLGGGPGTHTHGGGVSVADLTGDTTGTPAVAVTLVARQGRFRLASGEQVDGYSLNGTSPGPVLRVTRGALLQVTLVNANVRAGVTLHWHGVDVPNAADGVAGVTQDAVPVGGRHVYRFRPPDAGTYWYHSHQVSHEQVTGGLFGVLIVDPPAAAPAPEVVAAVHSYDGLGTVSGRTGTSRAPARPGTTVRVRVVNTETATISLRVSGAPFRLVALDGHDVHAPTPVRGRTVDVAAGGRVDLAVPLPADGGAVRVDVGVGNALVLGAPTAPDPPPEAQTGRVDPLAYGTPAPIGFDPYRPDRRFTYRVGRRIGFLDGRFGTWWTVNGRLVPDVPMFTVAEGDVVVMTLRNDSGSTHPMHLHGHHAVVISRNGVTTTGSPWWTDSLDVESGSTYVIAFVADNPGVWMDHCHNLPHATAGLLAHLSYLGVREPYRVGGPPGNEPE